MTMRISTIKAMATLLPGDLSSLCDESIGFPCSSKAAKSGVRLVGLEVGSGAAVPRASESSSRMPTGCPPVVG